MGTGLEPGRWLRHCALQSFAEGPGKIVERSSPEHRHRALVLSAVDVVLRLSVRARHVWASADAHLLAVERRSLSMATNSSMDAASAVPPTCSASACLTPGWDWDGTADGVVAFSELVLEEVAGCEDGMRSAAAYPYTVSP